MTLPAPVVAPVVAIDGPAGAGKGTAAQALARHLRWHYLDSGAFYRAVAFAALRDQVPLDDAPALADLAARVRIVQHLTGHGLAVHLDGQDVGARLREEATGTAASRIAAQPGVRRALLDGQRACRRAPGLVAEGRDMASTVFPDAALKIFLTASDEIRAARRLAQLSTQGVDATLPAILEDLRTRDQRDRAREASPLRAVPGATVVDSSALTATQVLDALLALCQGAGLSPAGA